MLHIILNMLILANFRLALNKDGPTARLDFEKDLT